MSLFSLLQNQTCKSNSDKQSNVANDVSFLPVNQAFTPRPRNGFEITFEY